MNRCLLSLFLSTLSVTAAPTVAVEKGRLVNSAWSFPSIFTPRRGDLAEQAKLSLASGALDPRSAPLKEFANGSVAGRGDDASQAVFLSNQDAKGARLLMDLGEVKPITQINSYSFHEYPQDGGARGPQVYALYGSADATPDAADLSKWTKIADVDTRPDKTGNDWGGLHGAQIGEDGKSLGNFRHLLWDIRPTLSPRVSAPEKTNTFFNEIDVHGPGTLEDAQPAQVSGKVAGVERIVLVYKTHFDIGYTALARDVIKNYRTTMIDQALKVVDQNAKLPREQQFVWTVPGWPMKEILADWPGQTADRQRRISDAFKDGRFTVHALPFTFHTDLMEPEELARSFVFSSNLSRAYGKPLPRAAKLTDVPCHSWVLPTVLKHAGVEFLHIGCNGHSSPVAVPPLFWWEGTDGSRVLTFYSPDGYGTSVLPPPNWPHKTWLALINTGDNHGPPRPEEVQTNIKAIQGRYPNAKITVGDLSDFADAILAEKPELPVVHKDMPDTWIHGPIASPIGAKIARNTRTKLAAAEMLGTLLGETNQAATIASAYESSLVYAEHTWGLSHGFHKHNLPDGPNWKEDFDKGRPGMLKRFEESWDEHDANIENAQQQTDKLMSGNLGRLANSVKVAGKRTVVFNPLPWERSGIVEVDGKPRFVEKVPAGGWITLSSSDTSASQKQTDTKVLENAHFRLTLAPDRAAVASLVDKRSGRELVKQDSDSGLGEYLYQQFSAKDANHFRDTYTRNHNAGFGKNWLPKDVPHIDARPAGAVWTVTKNGATDVAEAHCPAGNGVPHATRLRITLYQNSPIVDLEVGIENKPATPRPEAGWISLPFNVDTPAFRLGRIGGISDPAKDFVTASNRHLIALDSGMTVTAPDGQGVGLCSPDAPLISMEKPGCWEFSRDFTPVKPNVFVNLYNNMWSTNFRMWNEGTWSAKVRVWPTSSAAPEPSLVTPSWETRYPLVTATADGPAGTLPATAPGLNVSRKGVLVTAFGPNPDGAGTLLRVWEQAGTSGDLTITIPGKFKSATPVNLRGEKSGDPLLIKNGTITTPLPGFAPASFILTP